MTTHPSSSSSSTPPPLEQPVKKAGVIWTLAALSIIGLNVLLALAIVPQLDPELSNPSALIGNITGRTIILPLIVTVIFQIGKRSRNPRSQTKIIFWSSVFVLVSLLGSLSRLALEATAR